MTDAETESPALQQELLVLNPIENRTRVHALFETWRRALATDKRFATLAKSLKPEPPAEPEATKGGFEWRTTLRPTGLPAGLDFSIRLIDKSASYTPLDRNNQAAFGVDPTDGATYVLRQWYDTKRIGSRPLKAEALAKYAAPPSAELYHAPSQPNPGRGRLYLIVAKLTDPPEAIAQQTFEALAGFHKVAAAAREDAW
ncbi:hypothetical protein GCM10011504_31710 [Siccirubricoccus deserti]|uniref:Uncharacterized protein n=1 Tax=Siccirubricoccus deserti TaxID=2013562 RepID=A0A9X0QZC2_9PROT|nr:hypothetical protein [Siccirubricoccus deserti]MBC4016670.1 hypothetical protein [Siccirubricoccus deserti]GGC50973.1 hypothetical protein GCM10011504_31710 [Siccirubricoccus deserti]